MRHFSLVFSPTPSSLIQSPRGVAVFILTVDREIPGLTPARLNLQVTITATSWMWPSKGGEHAFVRIWSHSLPSADCVKFDSRFLCHLWRTNPEFGIGALQISLCSSPPHTPFWCWCKRHWLPVERDNVVYWKTKGKINNDLQCFPVNWSQCQRPWKYPIFEGVFSEKLSLLRRLPIESFFRCCHYLFPFLRIERVERWRRTEGESFLRLEVELDGFVGKLEKDRLVLSQASLRCQLKFCIQRTIFNITNIQFFHFFSLPHSDMWWCYRMM